MGCIPGRPGHEEGFLVVQRGDTRLERAFELESFLTACTGAHCSFTTPTRRTAKARKAERRGEIAVSIRSLWW